MKKMLLLLLTPLMLISGCKKEDPAPIKKVGKVVFWQTENTALIALGAGITTYKFYMAGQYIGSRSSAEYFDVAPGCDNKDPIVYEMDLGTQDQQTVAFKLLDQNNDQIVAYSITLKNKVCLQNEL